MASSTRRGARRAPAKKTAKQEREAPTSMIVQEVEVEVEDLANFTESRNIIVYGPTGHGKTTLAGGAPNPFFIAAEKGVEAARISGHKGRLVRAATWEQIVAAKKKADEVCGMDDWVILDSITKAQMEYGRWILRVVHGIDNARDEDIMAWQDYQKFYNGFKRFIDSMIDADYNCIFTSGEMFVEDKEGEPITLPLIEGKPREGYAICQYIMAQVDVILHLAMGEAVDPETEEVYSVRRVLAQPRNQYTAVKDRYHALGAFQYIDDEEYGVMADFITMIEKAAALQGEE